MNILKFAVAAGAVALACPANAWTTVNVGSSIASSAGFYETSQTVNYPGAFVNAFLHVVSAFVDGSAVILVNDVPVFGFASDGPGQGKFYFTETGSATPFNFMFGNGTDPRQYYLSGAFHPGANTIKTIVNAGSFGINASGQPLVATSSQLAWSGVVTYDKLSAGAGGIGTVPEPAAWAMMLTGFGLVGYAQRRRIPAVTAAC
jgi:hypothetical protein